MKSAHCQHFTRSTLGPKIQINMSALPPWLCATERLHLPEWWICEKKAAAAQVCLWVRAQCNHPSMNQLINRPFLPIVWKPPQHSCCCNMIISPAGSITYQYIHLCIYYNSLYIYAAVGAISAVSSHLYSSAGPHSTDNDFMDFFTKF